MTPFRVFVSWLAFLYLLYRSSVLSFPWILHKLEFARKLCWGNWCYLPYEDYTDLGRVLAWSPLWALCALLIIMPWLLMPAMLLRLIPRDENEDRQWPGWCNIMGRWMLAGLIPSLFFEALPDAAAGFLSYDPEYSHSFLGIFGIFVLGIVAAALVAPEVAVLASSGFTGFIDAVFFPGAREKLPPYTLKLARFYREKGRWEEAEAEYARMLSFYPDRREAWEERLTVAFCQGEQAEPDPEEVLAGALRALRTAEDREAVHAVFVRGGNAAPE